MSEILYKLELFFLLFVIYVKYSADNLLVHISYVSINFIPVQKSGIIIRNAYGKCSELYLAYLKFIIFYGSLNTAF